MLAFWGTQLCQDTINPKPGKSMTNDDVCKQLQLLNNRNHTLLPNYVANSDSPCHARHCW